MDLIPKAFIQYIYTWLVLENLQNTKYLYDAFAKCYCYYAIIK